MTKTLGLNAERVAPDSNIEGGTESDQGQASSPINESDVAALQSSNKGGNGPTLEAYNASEKLFIHHTEGGMTAARACAEMGGIHFNLTGDTTFMVRFLTAVRKHGKNYVRQAALQTWMLAHFPVEITIKEETVTITKNKLRAEKMWVDETAKQALLDKACSIPFWEFAPDKEAVRFGKLDLLMALKKTVEKYEDEDRYSASSQAALDTIKDVKNYIDGLIG
jgi:hypothetical protein